MTQPIHESPEAMAAEERFVLLTGSGDLSVPERVFGHRVGGPEAEEMVEVEVDLLPRCRQRLRREEELASGGQWQLLPIPLPA